MKTLLFLTVFLAGCGEFVTSSDDAKVAAQAYGIESPKVTNRYGVAPMLHGCTDQDTAAYRVVGTRNQEQVIVVVCCGWPFSPPCRVRGAHK